MFVKVCGLTTPEQVEWAIELGYDAIGLMRVPSSARFVDEATARELLAVAAGRIKTFAVGLTRDQVASLEPDVDTVQIYETAEDIASLAYASSELPEDASHLDYWFFDASHGTGEFTEPPTGLHTLDTQVVIAGGLHPNNVAEVIDRYRPDGVDVSSGVEKARGVKSRDLMERFITAVRNAQTG